MLCSNYFSHFYSNSAHFDKLIFSIMIPAAVKAFPGNAIIQQLPPQVCSLLTGTTSSWINSPVILIIAIMSKEVVHAISVVSVIFKFFFSWLQRKRPWELLVMPNFRDFTEFTFFPPEYQESDHWSLVIMNKKEYIINKW